MKRLGSGHFQAYVVHPREFARCAGLLVESVKEQHPECRDIPFNVPGLRAARGQEGMQR